MDISVLLCLYKDEDASYFEKSMQSIWDMQTLRPNEIVLVEDGPLTPQLYFVIKHWRKRLGSLLVTVTLPENVGLAKALNLGIMHCQGDYIARMDSDDISLPMRFNLQKQYLDLYPDIYLLGGAIIEIDIQDNEICRRKMPLTHENIINSIPKTSPFAHPAMMIRREVFDSGMIYSEKFRRCQDIDLWFRIISEGYKGANLPDFILKFRKSPNLYIKRKQSSVVEFKIFMYGIFLLYGFWSWRYIYPIIHFLFRKLPSKWCLWIYKHLIVKYWNK